MGDGEVMIMSPMEFLSRLRGLYYKIEIFVIQTQGTTHQRCVLKYDKM